LPRWNLPTAEFAPSLALSSAVEQWMAGFSQSATIIINDNYVNYNIIIDTIITDKTIIDITINSNYAIGRLP
jgi:hypothetical protein